MHILIGLLGSIITILFLLDRMGIDLGGLNPFYYFRRRAFAKKYGADPIFAIEDPIHIAALMVVGTAKIDGDLTAEQKQSARELFVSEFSVSQKESNELFGSAAHLLAAPQLVQTQLDKLASRNKDRFSRDQAQSMLEMMHKVASAGGELSAEQRGFIERVRSLYVGDEKTEGTWT